MVAQQITFALEVDAPRSCASPALRGTHEILSQRASVELSHLARVIGGSSDLRVSAPWRAPGENPVRLRDDA